MQPYIRLAATALTAAVGLVACQDSTTGIFFHIANEKVTSDTSLPNDLIVGDVTRWGGGTDDILVVAAGALRFRPVDTSTTTDWSAVTSTFPNGATEASVRRLISWQPATGDPLLLAAVHFTPDDTYGLLHASPTDVTVNLASGSQSTSITWAAATDTVVADLQIVELFTAGPANQVLFVLTATGGSTVAQYALHSSSVLSAGSPDLTTELSGLPQPVSAVTYDASSYWVATGPDLYRGALTSLTELATPPASTAGFRGALYYAGTPAIVMVSSADGKLWSTADHGVSWTGHPTEAEAISGQVVEFQSLAAVDTTVLVGTDRFGYYTVADGVLSDTTVARFADFTHVLYESAVHRFHVDIDGEDTTVFALTNGNGLLTRSVEAANPIDASDPPPAFDWKQE